MKLKKRLHEAEQNARGKDHLGDLPVLLHQEARYHRARVWASGCLLSVLTRRSAALMAAPSQEGAPAPIRRGEGARFKIRVEAHVGRYLELECLPKREFYSRVPKRGTRVEFAFWEPKIWEKGSKKKAKSIF